MLIYNGVNFKNRFNGDFRIIQISGRGPAPQESNILVIPGRTGAFHRFKRRNTKTISVSFELRSSSKSDLLEKVRMLSEILDVDAPVPLALPDEDGLIRYAIMDGEPDWEELFHKGRGTIHFLCPDPYAYGPETLQDLTALKTVINDGTAETYPIFEVDVLEPITSLEIRNKSIQDRLGENPAIVLGRHATIEEVPFVREELVFHDSMQSTQTWQQAVEIDNGYITGEIGVDSKGFYPKLFGEGVEPGAWQGPSLQRGIGTSLQDFRADIRIENFNTAAEIGMMAVYFRDSNNNKIANIGFGDAWLNHVENFGHAQLGHYDSGPRVDAYADYPYGWNDFDGIMRIERVDNVWRFYYAKIMKDGTHNWVHSKGRIVDSSRAYMAPINTIQVAFRLWYGAERTDMHIKDIKLYRINEEPQLGNSVPYLAQAGDKITIDTKTGQVRKNGEIANDLLDLQTRMFPLQKGYNRFEISNGINVKARYRKAYL